MNDASPPPPRVEMMALDALIPLAKNAKGHDIPKITKSIRRFGFVMPPTIDENTSQLAAGHGRLKALEKMRKSGQVPPPRISVTDSGMWEVPVLRGIAFANQHELEAYAIADNRITEAGGWDKDKLNSWLAAGDADFESIGFEQAEVDKLLGVLKEEDATEDGSEFVFQVVVECSDEDEQAALLGRFESEGLTCRPLIS